MESTMIHVLDVPGARPDISALILNGISDAVILSTIHGYLVQYWNHAAESLYGWTTAEALGRPMFDLLRARELGGATIEATLAAFSSQQCWRGEMVQRHRDGHELVVETSLRYVPDADGTPTGLLVIIRDPRAARSAETTCPLSQTDAVHPIVRGKTPATMAAVRNADSYLRVAFYGAHACNYLLDREYRFVDFNPMVAQAFRRVLHRDIAVGDSILEHIMPAHRDSFVAHFQHALGGASVRYERVIAEGTPKSACYEVRIFPVRGTDDSIVGVVFSGLDITAHRQAEASLRLYHSALGAVGIGILIADAGQPDMPAIYVNPACERITGYSAAELLGRNCRMLTGPGTAPSLRTQIREALAAGRGCHVTILNYRKDGRQFWNDLNISPVTDELGHVTHFIGVQTDVTERVALEADLRHAQRMETIGHLAGGIAHDFNNLLTVIGGATRFACALLPPEHPAHLELAEILRATGRAVELTRSLLNSARKQNIRPVVLNLNSLVLDVERMLRRLVAVDITLDLDLDPGLAPVLADAAQIEQVLVNLAVNACDAMPAGGVLTITTRNLHIPAPDQARPSLQPGHHVTVEVRDTGVGMTPEIQAHLFEPYFTTKGAGLGTGLGLATSNGIVKQHRGHISCTSVPAHGTCFCVTLPADRWSW